MSNIKMLHTPTSEMWLAFSKPLLKNHPIVEEQSMFGIMHIMDATPSFASKVENLVTMLEAAMLDETSSAWTRHPAWWDLYELLCTEGPRVQWDADRAMRYYHYKHLDGWHAVDVFPQILYSQEVLESPTGVERNVEQAADVLYIESLNKYDVSRYRKGTGIWGKSPKPKLYKQMLDAARTRCTGNVVNLEEVYAFLETGRCVFECHGENHLMAMVCYWMHQQLVQHTPLEPVVRAQLELMHTYTEWTWDTFVQSVKIMRDAACNNTPQEITISW